jgi:hypothetical protein
MWCVPEIDREFIDRIEELLELYARPVNASEPVVCLDERPVQLLDAERPGRPATGFIRPKTLAELYSACFSGAVTSSPKGDCSLRTTLLVWLRLIEFAPNESARARREQQMQENFCTQCGRTIAPGAKSCGSCGLPLAKTVPPATVVYAPGTSPQAIGHPRPWVRYWARSIDEFWFIAVMAFVAPSVLREASSKVPGYFFGLLALFAWVFVEPVLLSTFGTTPGKWLLRTKIVPVDGGAFTYSRALNRAFSVWLRGLGIGIPIVSLVTMSRAHARLLRTGTTSWDREGGFEIVHERIGRARTLAALLFLAANFSLVIYGNIFR